MVRLTIHRSGGVTLIELIIAVAVLSVVLSGAHSWYANHSIRTKINLALSEADSAKLAITITCAEDPGITVLKNSLIGKNDTKALYVESITLSGNCASPIITVITTNTGLLINPTLIITGDNSIGNGQQSWTCASDGLDLHIPYICRS
jgi:prepilin-type N-terminal cleavage/methylation domain-containing protein